MSHPVRIQLSRKKGADYQAASRAINGFDAVNVTRSTVFGNPFVVSVKDDALWCVNKYDAMFTGFHPEWYRYCLKRETILRNLPRLRGKNLACYCALDAPCHADVLLRLAREMVCEEA